MNLEKRLYPDAPELGQGEQENNNLHRPVQQEKKFDDLHPLIRVENLFLRYSSRTVLENISLDIQRGCITALIGPSAAEKPAFYHASTGLAT